MGAWVDIAVCLQDRCWPSPTLHVAFGNTRISMWSWGGGHSWYEIWALPQNSSSETRADSKAVRAAFAPWLVWCGLCSTIGHGLAFVTSQNLFPITRDRAAASATTGGPTHSDIFAWALWGRAHPGPLMKTLTEILQFWWFWNFHYFFPPNLLFFPFVIYLFLYFFFFLVVSVPWLCFKFPLQHVFTWHLISFLLTLFG